jgi:small subunit ribosomal protein S21
MLEDLVIVDHAGSPMSEVRVNPDDSFELALKKFNRKVQQDGILSEARRRAHYENPQARRKRKAAAQRRKMRRTTRQP